MIKIIILILLSSSFVACSGMKRKTTSAILKKRGIALTNSDKMPLTNDDLRRFYKNACKKIGFTKIKVRGGYLRCINGGWGFKNTFLESSYDEPRTRIIFGKEQADLIKSFKREIPSGIIFHESVLTSNNVTFSFYPRLTQQEHDDLQMRITPLEKDITITFGEYLATAPSKKIKTLSTFAIDVGTLIYDKKKKNAVLYHSKTEYVDIILMRQIKQELLDSGSNEEDLMFWGTDSITSSVRELYFDKMFKSTRYDLPRSFSFDLKTQKILPYNMKYVTNISDRIGEILIKMKHGIPYIRKFIKF